MDNNTTFSLAEIENITAQIESNARKIDPSEMAKDISDIVKSVNELDKCEEKIETARNQIIAIYSKMTGLSPESIKTFQKNRPWARTVLTEEDKKEKFLDSVERTDKRGYTFYLGQTPQVPLFGYEEYIKNAQVSTISGCKSIIDILNDAMDRYAPYRANDPFVNSDPERTAASFIETYLTLPNIRLLTREETKKLFPAMCEQYPACPSIVLLPEWKCDNHKYVKARHGGGIYDFEYLTDIEYEYAAFLMRSVVYNRIKIENPKMWRYGRAKTKDYHKVTPWWELDDPVSDKSWYIDPNEEITKKTTIN